MKADAPTAAESGGQPAFRGVLIRWYNYTSAKAFGTLSTNAPVLVGKDGWLYLAKDRNRDVRYGCRYFTWFDTDIQMGT